MAKYTSEGKFASLEVIFENSWVYWALSGTQAVTMCVFPSGYCLSVHLSATKPSLSFSFPLLSVSYLSSAPLAYFVGQMDYEGIFWLNRT